jgi:hypothetical protein
MTGTTQERLRDATTALGQAIRREDIPELRLPEPGPRPAAGRLPRLRRRRPGARSWLIPAGAAASVLVALGLIVLAGQAGPGGGPSGGESPAPPSALAAGLPRYMVTYGNGVSFVPGGGPGYVRATATGRIVARIPAAGRDFTVEGLAAAPGDRTFYLIGEDAAGSADGGVQIECFRIELTANGRPGAPQRLPGAPLLAPLPPTSNGATSIPLAVSPDGKELAYPSAALLPSDSGVPRTADAQSVIVQNVATGARRSWTAWPASHAQVSQVSWAADGRLGFVAGMYDAAVTRGAAVVAHRDSYLNVFMILNTAAAGSTLISASALVSYGSATASASGTTPSMPPGPVAGVISQDGRSVYAQVLTQRGASWLVALSAASGKITRVLLSGPQAVQAAPVSIDGDDLLFTLGVRHRPVRQGGAPYVSGHLAGLNLATGQIVALPLPVYTGVEMPAGPMETAW